MRAAREKSGLTKMDVVRRAGIAHSYLGRMEAGQVPTPSPHILRKLAGPLGVDYVDLIRAVGYLTEEDVWSAR